MLLRAVPADRSSLSCNPPRHRSTALIAGEICHPSLRLCPQFRQRGTMITGSLYACSIPIPSSKKPRAISSMYSS